VGAPAPFHPTAAGELAIALADEQALQSGPGTSSGSPSAAPPRASPATSPAASPAASPSG
jgi:hypothetical protein